MSYDEERKEIGETLKRELEESDAYVGMCPGRDGIASVKSKEAFTKYNKSLLVLKRKYNRSLTEEEKELENKYLAMEKGIENKNPTEKRKLDSKRLAEMEEFLKKTLSKIL